MRPMDSATALLWAVCPDLIALDANHFSDGRYGIFLDDLSGTGENGEIRLHDSDNTFSSIQTPRQGLDQACVKNY